MQRALILAPTSRSSADDDIALTRLAAECGYEAVWAGERSTTESPARLAALAASTSEIGLGIGLVPLTGRDVDHLEETLTTLSLIAGGRVLLAFDLPAALAGPVRPAWVDRLTELAPAVRRAGVPLGVSVADVGSATQAAPHVDRVVLRTADRETLVRTVEAVGRFDHAPDVDVWCDLAVGADAVERLRPTVAERIAVPGVPGNGTMRTFLRRSDLTGLRGDIESAYARGRLDEAAALVPTAVVESTCLVGEEKDLSRRIVELGEAGAARVAVLPHASDVPGRRTAVTVFATASAPGVAGPDA